MMWDFRARNRSYRKNVVLELIKGQNEAGIENAPILVTSTFY
jgi:hypothetical protein